MKVVAPRSHKQRVLAQYIVVVRRSDAACAEFAGKRIAAGVVTKGEIVVPDSASVRVVNRVCRRVNYLAGDGDVVRKNICLGSAAFIGHFCRDAGTIGSAGLVLESSIVPIRDVAALVGFDAHTAVAVGAVFLDQAIWRVGRLRVRASVLGIVPVIKDNSVAVMTARNPNVVVVERDVV